MSNDVTSTTSAHKQLMRRDAAARRRTVKGSERKEAGAKLARNAAMLLADNTTPLYGTPAKALATNRAQTAVGTKHTQRGRRSLSEDTVAAYISMGTEVPTIHLLECLRKYERRVLVPRLGSGRDIGWGEYDSQDSLHTMPRTVTGGIRPQEPSGKALAAQAIEDASMVFIPAFAIDLDGNRLGRGGGWYDRVLRWCRPDVVKVGVCWDWELIGFHEAVPHETHDIPVDAAVTPERFLWLR